MGMRAAWAVTLLCVWSAAPAAVQLALDARAIDEAIAIGQSRIDLQRTRFHAPYRMPVSQPPVDRLEIVTPFRRVVLAAEDRARIGDRSFGQRQALQALAARPDQIDIRLDITFHPLHTFIRVPDYEVALASADGLRHEPHVVDRLPQYGRRVDGAPPEPVAPHGSTQPLLGATVVAGFDGHALDIESVYTVIVSERGQELARVRIGLAAVR